MKLSKPLIIITIAAAFAVPAAAGNTNTGSNADKAGVQVNYSDLDISSQTGAAILYSRLKSASRAVCGTQNSVLEAGSIEQLQSNRECFEQTLARSVNKVDSATLRSLHAS